MGVRSCPGSDQDKGCITVVVVILLLTTKSHTNRSNVLNIFYMRTKIFKNIFVFCRKHDFLLQKGTMKLYINNS